MLIPIDNFLRNSPDSYFLDLAKQMEMNIDNAVVCHGDEIEGRIREHNVIFCIRGSGMRKKHLFEGKKVIVQYDDIHYWDDAAKKMKMDIFDRADVILLPYYGQFMALREYKKFHSKAVWFPYHVPQIVREIQDIGWENKTNKALLTGNTAPIYSFRRLVVREKNEIVDVLEHPGQRGVYKHDVIGLKYFQHLSSYKGGIVTSADQKGIFNLKYTLMKYFEIPACGVVPFMEKTGDLNVLGFKDGENCILVTQENYISKIKEHLNNAEIAAKAKALVLERHTFAGRLDTIKKVIS